MHRSLDIDLIFPIRDKSSAQLMALKARCLHEAGVIGGSEKDEVLRKAAMVLTAPDCDRELVSAGRDVSVYGLKAYSHQGSFAA